jgi:biopolymer transport protein ExbD
MNIKKRYKAQPELHAGALNDILFILLFFFLIVATLANPNIIPLNVPRSKGETKAKQSVIVNIKPTGEYILNGKQVPYDQLKGLIEPILLKDTTNAMIGINADKNVPVDNVVAVMRIALELNAKSSILVDPKGAQ